MAAAIALFVFLVLPVLAWASVVRPDHQPRDVVTATMLLVMTIGLGVFSWRIRWDGALRTIGFLVTLALIKFACNLIWSR